MNYGLPLRVGVSLLEHFDNVWVEVGGVTGIQQVQQDFPTVLVVDDFIQILYYFLRNEQTQV